MLLNVEPSPQILLKNVKISKDFLWVICPEMY